MNKSQALKKGFTLIELLIVIAILAILGSAVVVVLNPAEILAQTRDGTRVSDLNTLRNAINNYLVNTTQSPPNLGLCAAGGRCTADPGALNGPFTSTTCALQAGTGVTGTGWVDINFGTVTGGSPIAALPLDPTNSATYFYGYMCSGGTGGYVVELDTRLESVKQRGKMTADGGNKNTCTSFTETTCFFEIGTDPGLDL